MINKKKIQPKAFILKHIIFKILCVLLLFFSFNTLAQNTYLPHYTTKNGLASNNCYYILQDKKGFIWVATDGGLSRFDGTNFQNFSIEDGLPDTQILQIKEDKEGKLWFLTLNGQIGYFFDGKFYNPENNASLKQLNFNTIIVSFLEDSKGNIWLGTNTNLILKFDGKNIQKFVSNYANDKFTNAFIHEDNQGNIYSYSTGSVQKFDGKKFQLSNIKVHPLSYKNAFNTLKKSLLFIDKTGLKKFENNTITNLVAVQNNILTHMDGYFYYEEKNKNLWISSSNGAIHISPDGKQTNYLKNVSINQTIKDDHENLWFATAQGIYMLPNINARLYYFDASDGLSSNVIKSITEDDQNKLWMGTDNGYINVLNIKNNQISKIKIPDSKKFNNIKQISFDSKNSSIYFASDYGLGTFSIKNTAQQQLKYLKESNNLVFVIKNFSINKTNNQLALALSSGVVFLNDRIENLTFNSLKYKEQEDFFGNRSYHAFYDNVGSLWFSNINGLSQFSNGNLNKHYEKTPLLTKRINDIQQLNDGTLVLATDGYGLIFYKNNKIAKQITKNQGLASDICTKIFIKGNEIWVLTNNGVNKIANYNSNANITNFDYGKELLTDDVNNIFVDDSTAYFATNKGLITFKYSAQGINNSTPKIYITTIRKDKNRLPVNSNNLEFDYDSKTILFTFSAVDFTTTDITYRYRLNENADWVETRTRRLDLSSLQPGNYTFEVQAKNQNGKWSSSAKKTFAIKKPIWQSFWFLTALVLLVGYLFYKLAVFITRKQKDKEQQELLVRNKILMLEQQALQAMMNPHFVFNVMNSIQHFINTQNTALANKVLTGFAKLIRKNLEICTKSYISLDEEIDYLSLYLKLEKNRFGDKLNYKINVDENIDKDETLIPSMLLQPYVENAIWHGIMPEENGGNIEINISKTNTDLVIKIIDDGIGIDNSLKTKSGNHQSKGMQMTKERLALLGQIEAKPIQLNVKQNTLKGTTVYISIPLK